VTHFGEKEKSHSMNNFTNDKQIYIVKAAHAGLPRVNLVYAKRRKSIKHKAILPKQTACPRGFKDKNMC
jgi:hypothetical protein